MATLEQAIRSRIDNYIPSLSKKTSEELKIICKAGFDEALLRDKDERVKNEFWQRVVANNVFYEGIAAREILEKRNYSGYNTDLICLYLPYFNSICEKNRKSSQLYYFLTGNLPE